MEALMVHVGAASREVMSVLGKTHTEATYGRALKVELDRRINHSTTTIVSEVVVPYMYSEVPISYGRADFILIDTNRKALLVVELKVLTYNIRPEHIHQARHYMQSMINFKTYNGYEIGGVIINFNQSIDLRGFAPRIDEKYIHAHSPEEYESVHSMLQALENISPPRVCT